MIRFINTRWGTEVSVQEESDILEQMPENASETIRDRFKILAKHAGRTARAMDLSQRWERADNSRAVRETDE
jgi:hypothetical protein